MKAVYNPDLSSPSSPSEDARQTEDVQQTNDQGPFVISTVNPSRRAQ